MLNIVDPLIQHIKKELENTLLKIHREDFSRLENSYFLSLFLYHATDKLLYV